MKRLLTIIAILVLGIESASAWGKFGHEIVVEVAKRHLTENTKAKIAKYLPYDITQDAVWMDIHRFDKEIKYTNDWHVYNIDEKHEYDMNPRLHKGGDAIYALGVVKHNLSKQERLTDSAIVMNIRCLLHFAGDMHCPAHTYPQGVHCFWPCTLNGVKYRYFHTVYDLMPDLVFPNMSCAEVAAKIDNAKRGEIKCIQRGEPTDWVKRDVGQPNSEIYKWNKFLAPDLDPNTVEMSRELITMQLRNAGYRLAYLLNKYFDK